MMTFEKQMNLINGNPLFQTFFLNNLLQNPQIFQYMISQMQYIPRVDLREENTKTQEDQNSDRKILEQEKLTKNSKQLLVGSEANQQPKGNMDSEEEESSSRVNGHWSKPEHQLYLQFVNDHEDILRSKYDKKSKKIFKLMSQYILTRTATQCRSHHQKFNPLQKSKRKGKSFVRPIPSVIIQEN